MLDMRKPQVIDLNESIRLTAKLAKTQLHPNRIQLDLQLSSRSPRVLVHPADFAQALLNLLTNAAGKVRITSAVIRNHVLVSVIDDAQVTELDARMRLSPSRSIMMLRDGLRRIRASSSVT